MTKAELEKICNVAYVDLINSNYTGDAILNKLNNYSTNGKLSLETSTVFALIESQLFAKELLFKVLSEVLNVEDNIDVNVSEKESIDT